MVGAEKVEAEEEEEAAGTRDDGIYSLVAEIYEMLICKMEEEVRREGLLLHLPCLNGDTDSQAGLAVASASRLMVGNATCVASRLASCVANCAAVTLACMSTESSILCCNMLDSRCICIPRQLCVKLRCLRSALR